MDRVRRRLIGSAALALLASSRSLSAPSPIKRVTLFVGVPPDDPDFRNRNLAAFEREGFVEGRNFAFTIVDILGANPEEIERRARNVVASRPDVILVISGHWALLFQRLTRDIPIVFFSVGDPVRLGLVADWRRPGRNITGESNRGFELEGKRLELLKEMQPRAKRVAVLTGAGPLAKPAQEELVVPASRLGVELVHVVIDAWSSEAAVLLALREAKSDGVLVQGYGEHAAAIRGLLNVLESSRLPAVFQLNWSVERGGLASLGERFGEHGKRAIRIAARILRGESPAMIPVDQLTTVHLAINLRTARAMGLAIPQAILLRADQVIE